MNASNFSNQIKEQALILGFDACGISSVEELSEEKEFLDEWLNIGYHGEMAFMERNKEKRTNPALLVDGSKSVISVLMNYFPEKQLHPESHYNISKYAFGTDYHDVIKDRLKELMAFIKIHYPEANMRSFTDSAPIMDKRWAQKAGLGWIGKNTLLMNKELGSFFFIGEIVVNLELIADSPLNKEYCGSCTQCIDACPTDALRKPYLLNASRCITYLNAESKKDIPKDLIPKMNNWIYGCDICQDVCPWNTHAKSTNGEFFKMSNELVLMKKQDWDNMEQPKFNRIFKNTPVERSGYDRLKMMIDLE